MRGSWAWYFVKFSFKQIEYSCHIWGGTKQSWFRQNPKSFWQSQKGRNFLYAGIRRHNIESVLLIYPYFQGKYSDELHSLLSQTEQTFEVKSHTAASTGLNHHHSLRSPFMRSMFHSESFFRRIVTLWDRLPRDCFPAIYNFNFFKSRANRYLSFCPHNLHFLLPALTSIPHTLRKESILKTRFRILKCFCPFISF